VRGRHRWVDGCPAHTHTHNTLPVATTKTSVYPPRKRREEKKKVFLFFFYSKKNKKEEEVA
jgi:hypothetical protein